MKTNEKSAESLHETNANLKSTIRDIMNWKKILIKSGLLSYFNSLNVYPPPMK